MRQNHWNKTTIDFGQSTYIASRDGPIEPFQITNTVQENIVSADILRP